MSTARRRSLVATVIAIAIVTGCDTDDGRTLDPPVFPPPASTLPTTTLPAETTEDIVVEAPPEAFFQLIAPWPSGAPMPDRHTCFGDGVPPGLSWSGVPLGTSELVLTLTDLDDGTRTLWIVDGIPATVAGFVEGELPDLAFERANTSGGSGYEAPCPPDGESHTYQLTLHAMPQQLEVAEGATAEEVIARLDELALAQASVSALVSGTSPTTEPG